MIKFGCLSKKLWCLRTSKCNVKPETKAHSFLPQMFVPMFALKLIFTLHLTSVNSAAHLCAIGPPISLLSVLLEVQNRLSKWTNKEQRHSLVEMNQKM